MAGLEQRINAFALCSFAGLQIPSGASQSVCNCGRVFYFFRVKRETRFPNHVPKTEFLSDNYSQRSFTTTPYFQKPQKWTIVISNCPSPLGY
jgi:hypothetical protein